MPQPSAQQALTSLESLERALARLLPAAESFEGAGGERGGREADAGAFEVSIKEFLAIKKEFEATLLFFPILPVAPDSISRCMT